MRSDALVVVLGHLGGDAKVTDLASGKRVVSFSVAVNRRRQGKLATLWCRAEIWNPDELLVSQLRKGAYVRVMGSLQPDEYRSANGALNRGFVISPAQVIVIFDAHADEPSADGAAEHDF